MKKKEIKYERRFDEAELLRKKFDELNQNQNIIINENKKVIKYLQKKMNQLKKKALKINLQNELVDSKNEIHRRRRIFRSFIRNIEGSNLSKSGSKSIKFSDPSVFIDEKDMNIVQ